MSLRRLPDSSIRLGMLREALRLTKGSLGFWLLRLLLVLFGDLVCLALPVVLPRIRDRRLLPHCRRICGCVVR